MAAKSPAMRIVVLGSGAVGKSSLTVRLTTGKFFEDYDPVSKEIVALTTFLHFVLRWVLSEESNTHVCSEYFRLSRTAM